jgi:putative peptidoglycan lipid II flippase
MFIVQIVMMPLGRVLMPALSRLAAQRDYESMRRTMSQLVRIVGFLVIPMVVFVSTDRFELLELMLKRGAFTDRSVDLTAYALLFYSLGIVPFLLTPLLNGAFFAMQNSRVPLKIGAVAVAANVVLDAILIHVLGHGGIALATSLVGLVRASLLWVFLRRRLGNLDTAGTLGSLLLSVLAACAAFWGARVIAEWLPLTAIPSTLIAGIVAHAAYGAALYGVFQALFNRGLVRRFVRFARRRGGVLAG